MHDLITGGSGFIGRALCQSLLDDGHRVTVLTRSVQRAAAVLPEAAKCVTSLQTLDDVDAVYNLAGENLAAERWTAVRKQAFRDSRIGGTDALVAWMRGLKRWPAVLVSASAIGYYGPHDDDLVTEATPPGDDFAARLCVDWEAAALAAQTLGVRVCTPRIGVVLGTEGGALAQMLPAFRLGGGGRMGSGRQWMSWIHRADLVALLRWLAETPQAGGAYNATAPQPVTNADFARALGRALHRPALLPMPAVALKLLFGEMSGLLLTGQRVLPERAHDAGFMFRYATLDAALESLLGAP